MKRAFVLIALIFLLGSCASMTPMQEADYQATCRTHARTVSYSGSPDENIPYLECMRIKGQHDVVVEKMP